MTKRALTQRPLAGDERAVSPVIGMILVLAISIVGIAAITYWGLPAIDEMKANVEFRSVQTQFSELDGTIKELVAGTTEKTAKRWQPAISRGELAVYNNTEPWLYAVEMYNADADGDRFNLQWGNFSDGDSVFSLQNVGHGFDKLTIQAYVVTGSSTQTALNVTAFPTTGSGNAEDDQMTTTAGSVAMPNTSSREFKVWVKGAGSPTAKDLKLATFHFVVWEDDAIVAQAWYVATGRIDYDLHAGVGEKSVTANNGAVIAGTNGQFTIVGSPSIPPSVNTSGVPRTFARAVVLGGTSAFAGDDRFDVLISLYSTASLASYDCAKTDMSDCVISSKVFNWGEYAGPWNAYLSNSGMGYHFTKKLNSAVAPGVTEHYLEERQWKMAYTLLESNLKLVG